MNRIRQITQQPIFLIFFVFVCFSVMPVFSSTGASAPNLEFTKWKAGQGQEYTVSNPPHTFITDTETTCEITATVAYASSQPSSVYPLTSYTWQVTGSHGYTFTTQTEASGPVGQTGTTFKLTASGTGDQHNSSTGGHRPMRGRSEKPIKFTVKFIGEYGSGGGSNPQTVEVDVVFEQDKKDQMRQEYLDVRRLHETHRDADANSKYGDLRVPGRGAFTTSGQRFNNGHYSYLINKSLEDKIRHWWQACDKVAYEDLKNNDLTNDRGNKELRLTNGYRSPHHHVYHVYAGKPMSSIKYWSLHQFGLALDVGAMDMNGKNGITNVDRGQMRDAAMDHAGASYSYYAGHVHAQWGAVRNAPGGDSTSSQRSTQTTTPETTPTTVTGACGVHTIASSETSSHAQKTGDCGHTYYVCSQGNHDKLQASCSTTNSSGQRCTVTNFYACQSHTHTYPTDRRCMRVLVGGTCAKGGYVSSSDNHFGRCSQGHVYFDCHPASVEQHKVRTCARCSNTYQNCQGNSNPCSSGRGHSETADPPAEAPSTPQPNPSPPSEPPPTTSPEESTATETGEQETEEEETTEVPAETPPARPTAVCGSGHTYSTDRTSDVDRHKDRTCLRCSETYQNCSNSATACQNTRWHTQDNTAYMRGACGHSHRINEKSQHALVTCTTTNANGDRCNGGSYYACQSHTHTYPAPTETPTPTPSPPENSNPNDNENEEEEAEEEVPTAPTLSYHQCGIHLTTVSGVHSLQASCSTDSTCIATSFYQCQHSSHTYPAPPPPPPPPPPTTGACGAASWTGCTADVSSSTEHNVSCRANHSYWTCGTSSAWHASRTCTRCGNTYSNCDNSSSACQSSKWHTETPQVVLVACGAASWTGCTSQLTSSTEHQVSCSGGHSYWTCGTATAWHKDRTCSRCSQTYQNCGNSATACQGSRWHTE